MCSTEESELCDWRLEHLREFSDLTGWERNLAALSLGTYGDDSNSRNYSVTLSATGERVRIISLFLDLGDWGGGLVTILGE